MSLTYGDLWRLAHPVVRDFVGGLALGQNGDVPRLAVEPNRQLPEPGADAGAWPPEPGSYDKSGLNIGAAGDLARLGFALTIPSVRAFLLGLAQRAGAHSERALTAVAETASTLVEAAGSSGLTRDELLDV